MIIEESEIIELFDEFYFIDEAPQKEAKVNENTPKIHIEGGNKSGLVFVFAHDLSTTDQDMIHKLIHNALKIKMEDMALVYMNQHPEVKLKQVIDIIKPKQLVLWGTDASFPSGELYQKGEVQQISFVKVDEVNRFHHDVALKTQLWNAIQQLING